MLVRAKLENNSKIEGYTLVGENCQVVQYGGAFFIYAETTERVEDGARYVQRVFKIVTTDIEVKATLDEEF